MFQLCRVEAVLWISSGLWNAKIKQFTKTICGKDWISCNLCKSTVAMGSELLVALDFFTFWYHKYWLITTYIYNIVQCPWVFRKATINKTLSLILLLLFFVRSCGRREFVAMAKDTCDHKCESIKEENAVAGGCHRSNRSTVVYHSTAYIRQYINSTANVNTFLFG